jgi:hypothetical protein
MDELGVYLDQALKHPPYKLVVLIKSHDKVFVTKRVLGLAGSAIDEYKSRASSRTVFCATVSNMDRILRATSSS